MPGKGFALGNRLIPPIVAVGGLALLILALPFAGVTKPSPLLGKFYGLHMWAGKPERLDATCTPKSKGNNPCGTFGLEYRPFGLESKGQGGACLIADIAALVPVGNSHYGEIHRGSCTKKEECQPGNKPGFPPAQIWEGYCVPEGKKKEGRCWYRPDDHGPLNKSQLCHTSGHNNNKPWLVGVDQIVPHASTVGSPTPTTTPPLDLETFYGLHTEGKPAEWRVSNLLIGTFGARHFSYGKPECLSPDKKKC
jgi:hypothetical protein